MLSSIHPLGERARHNRWWLTVAAFAFGATAAGAALGAALGLAGNLVGLSRLPWGAGPLAAGAAAVLAGVLDLARVRPPGPTRQVNERWIGAFRGWVYGSGFGAQLGLGASTFVVTWSVYAWMAASVLTSHATSGALIGAVFGIGRSLTLLGAGRIQRPGQLVAYTAHMARLARPAHGGLAVLVALGGLFAMVGS